MAGGDNLPCESQHQPCNEDMQNMHAVSEERTSSLLLESYSSLATIAEDIHLIRYGGVCSSIHI